MMQKWTIPFACKQVTYIMQKWRGDIYAGKKKGSLAYVWRRNRSIILGLVVVTSGICQTSEEWSVPGYALLQWETCTHTSNRIHLVHNAVALLNFVLAGTWNTNTIYQNCFILCSCICCTSKNGMPFMMQKWIIFLFACKQGRMTCAIVDHGHFSGEWQVENDCPILCVLSIKSSWCRKPKRCAEQQSCMLIMCSERTNGSCASLVLYRAWEANHSQKVQCPLWFFSQNALQQTWGTLFGKAGAKLEFLIPSYYQGDSTLKVGAEGTA